MHILMQTQRSPYCLEQQLTAHVEFSEYNVDLLTIGPSRVDYVHRILRAFAPGIAFHDLNRQLIADIEKTMPDVFWVFKGMQIYPRTLRKLRSLGVMLVNYNADHPFRHFSRGSGNANVKNSVPLYDLHLTYSRAIALELSERFGDTNVSVVPFGHSVSDQIYEGLHSLVELPQACFVGNPDVYRGKSIMALVRAGVPVDVYGNGWNKFLTPSPLLELRQEVTGVEMLKVLRRYRLQLNFFRPHNVQSHNMRTFEVPACGGIMLSQDSPEQRNFFRSSVEAFYFRDTEEMIALTKMILGLTAEEANAVRRAARERSVKSGYSYQDRMRQALDAIADAYSMFQFRTSGPGFRC